MKDQILIGDQLIDVDDDYFPTRDLVQFIKNKQSNPVHINFQSVQERQNLGHCAGNSYS